MYQELIKNKYGNIDKLTKYVDLIEEKNKVMNLTGFTGEKLWKDGIYESIVCLESIKEGKLLDIGAGAGFPSIPYLLVNQNIDLTIYEPLQKRIKFLDEVKSELALTLELQVKRAEETEEEEKYDFVTARAVAPLKVLIEIAHKPLKVGGLMIFPKGIKYKQEIIDAHKIIYKLGLTYEIEEITQNQIKTFLVKIKKTSKTPNNIPRNWAQIKNG